MQIIIGHLLAIYMSLSARYSRFLHKHGRCICGRMILVKKGEQFPACPVHGKISYYDHKAEKNA